ncbi:hypothetical protein F5X99DRAFT_371864 [Biscogniauxia marginata]|nr:hypothetical protein F5X99DRAFT_371864 [Biscogniauxia marginata]
MDYEYLPSSQHGVCAAPIRQSTSTMDESSLRNQAQEQPPASSDPQAGEHEPQQGNQDEGQSIGEDVENPSLQDGSQAGNVPSNQLAVSDPRGQIQVEGQPGSQEIVAQTEQCGQLERRPSLLSRSSSKKPKSILRRSDSSIKPLGKTRSIRLDIPKEKEEKPRLPKDFYRRASTKHPRSRTLSEPYSNEADYEADDESDGQSRRPLTGNPLIRAQSAPGNFGMTRDDSLMTRGEAEHLENPQADRLGRLTLPADNHKIEAMGKELAAAAAADEGQKEKLRPWLLDALSNPSTSSPTHGRTSRGTMTQPSLLLSDDQWMSTPLLQENPDTIEMVALPVVSGNDGQMDQPENQNNQGSQQGNQQANNQQGDNQPEARR